MSDEELTENSDAEIRSLLLGRRIVAAEEGSFPVGRWSEASGRLTLDDGTQILVIPNEGGCSCGAGDYSLAHLASVDNVITAVRLATEDVPGDYESGTKYQIFVVADAVEVNVLSVEGDDGNGYYGTGYRLIVTRPARSGDAGGAEQ